MLYGMFFLGGGGAVGWICVDWRLSRIGQDRTG